MRSKYEENFAQNLVDRGIEYEYEPDRLPYTVQKMYTPDFKVFPKRDGSYMYIETKGFFKSCDRSKTLSILKQYPGIDLRMSFQRACNTLSKKSKTTYSAWADKHDILWCEGYMPDDWLEELVR